MSKARDIRWQSRPEGAPQAEATLDEGTKNAASAFLQFFELTAKRD